MLAVALGALRARRTQAVALLAIAALVTAAAVAAPFFVVAASAALAVREVAAAPPAQRLVTVHRDLELPGGLRSVSGYFDDVRAALALPGAQRVDGAIIGGQLTTQTAYSASPMAIRDGVCAQVRITGACPAGPREAMLSVRTATTLGLRVGDTVPFTSSALTDPVPLRVSGLYQPRDPASPYWGAAGLLGPAPTLPVGATPDPRQNTAAPDAAFVATDALLAAGARSATVTVDLVLSPATVTGTSAAEVAQRIDDGTARLRSAGYQLDSQVPDLLGRILDDQWLILVGVPAGAGELVLFGWYALVLAVGAGAAARRVDLGLLKLRGAPGRRLWALAAGQSTLPVLAGVLPGALLGWLLARVAAGPVVGGGQLATASLLALAAAGVAVLGGLLVALAAEGRAVRADVMELLRRRPVRGRARRRRLWRPEFLDLGVATLALAGVYQVHSAATGDNAGLVVLAPGLVAVAVGLLAARLLVPVAGRVAAAGLRAGRLRAALTGTYLARRPGLDRLFALLAIAVIVAGYGALEWGAAAAARHERAAQEVGAARVLTLDPVAAGPLLAAVRAADPSGRYAMAAVQTTTHTGVPGVLAVDATRLATVADWTGGYGPRAGRVAELLRPPSPVPVVVAGGELTVHLTLTSPGGTLPVYLVADLTAADGQPMAVRYGPLAVGDQSLTGRAAACARPPGCRLDGFTLATGFASNGIPGNPPGPGLDVTLRSFAGSDSGGGSTGGAEPAAFADRGRWRPTTDPGAAGPVLTSDQGGLRIALPAADQLASNVRREARVYPVDAPDPVPVVVAGELSDAGIAGAQGVDLFGGDVVPVRVAATVPVLPRLGRAGLLVDLDYADRLAGAAGADAVPQVWLAPGAPSSIVDSLTRAGLRVSGTDSVAQRQSRYGDSGPAVALRFQLLGAALAVILAAAGLILVAAVERDPRAEELVALRVQGMPAGSARAVAVGGYAWLAGAAVLTGLLVAPLDRLVTGANLPYFPDDWRVLPPPGPGGPAVTLLATGAAIVLLVGGAVAFGARELVRRLRNGGRR